MYKDKWEMFRQRSDTKTVTNRSNENQKKSIAPSVWVIQDVNY